MQVGSRSYVPTQLRNCPAARRRLPAPTREPRTEMPAHGNHTGESARPQGLHAAIRAPDTKFRTAQARSAEAPSRGAPWYHLPTTHAAAEVARGPGDDSRWTHQRAGQPARSPQT